MLAASMKSSRSGATNGALRYTKEDAALIVSDTD